MTEKEITEKVQEAKRAYQREWYAKNKDKCRERNRRYWMKKVLHAAEAQTIKNRRNKLC